MESREGRGHGDPAPGVRTPPLHLCHATRATGLRLQGDPLGAPWVGCKDELRWGSGGLVCACSEERQGRVCPPLSCGLMALWGGHTGT